MAKYFTVRMNLMGAQLLDTVKRGTVIHGGKRYKLADEQSFGSPNMQKLQSYWVNLLPFD